MILQSFGVEYEILEAQPSHIGGRLLTHRFSDGPNDYYDVGAMRFPNTYPMRRAFDLFHLTFGAPPAEGADVIDYYLSTPNDILSFNGITVNRKKLKEQGYQVFQPAIPESYVAQSVQYWLDAKVGYFKQQLKRDFTSGMKELQAYDYNSTRQFMHSLHPELKEELTEYVINWIETFSSGTSMYDCALTETVMDELDFNYAPDVSWKAIQGGTNRIALAMAKQLREAEYPTGRILQNKRVQKISPPPSDGSGPVSEDVKNRTMLVFVEGEAKPRVYDHVLSTVALGALRLINLDGCKLSWQLRESLRSLQYGPSVKVAIRFTHRWWESEIQNHRSGVTTTDRPTRMIVYPSYGIGSQDATMIVSYSWSQDALRLGTLVKGQGSLAEQRLIDLILQDLAEIHDIPFDDLKSWQVDYHAYNWYDNEFTVGAFAFFGPAQFRKMYQEVTQPAGLMHLYFAGEATSTNHAWVVGALDSSVRALEQIVSSILHISLYFFSTVRLPVLSARS
ncbi:amine oxidase [Irpex rosettiformis]|uniref:Amine oxidase n=1 Tax=Irpex rosettiformis TaxID=378272 RepID=A0ACB8TTY9_9APHY|nr:amine oxidase [Irpex rosettiformis]